MALQDHKEDTWRRAARAWAVALLVILASCASGPGEGLHTQRMRLYRKYYHNLTPVQRREFLSGAFTSPEAAEQQLRRHARSNRERATLLGHRDLKSSQIEQLWRRVDKFLAEAEDTAAGAANNPVAAAKLTGRCSELAEELKRAESQIRHTPYDASRRNALLQRNSYYASRVHALSKLISKSK